jgi:hypothetical protein
MSALMSSAACQRSVICQYAKIDLGEGWITIDARDPGTTIPLSRSRHERCFNCR